MTPTFAFDNSYATLPERFYARQSPVPVAAPQLLALNAPLAGALGLDAAALASPEGVAMLAGNAVPEGAAPLAQAYAGDQFGHFVPQLGDGRAVLLGEIRAPSGERFDLQLKGAGRTPFSRGGDGRAWLGPVLREYLVSEAMAALGIPTTRALAAVATGEDVYRETRLPGAVLARVAASHIRVGTFQYFAARGDTEALGLLADYAIARHHPGAEGAAGLLDAVIGAQARLVAQWLGAGFVHGVMNTDNMTISGETIDYGPCAFLDGFSPMQSFSAIDTFGRYAYARQPDVAVWNLARLASALLPLMGPDTERAIALATDRVQGFPDRFEAERRAVFGAKIGLAEPRPEDEPLIEGLLGLMAGAGADFTTTFRALAEDAPLPLPQGAALDDWRAAHDARLAQQQGGRAAAYEIMRAANPALIARNHQVEEVIAAALGGDMAPFHRLAAALARPFDPAPENAALALPPPPGAAVTRTFCGT